MRRDLESEIRQLRIVVGGLIFGLVSFLAISSQVAPVLNERERETAGWLLAGVPAFGAASAIGYVAMRRRLSQEIRTRKAERRHEANPLPYMMEPYRRFVVAGGGLIEGPGMFSIIAYAMTGQTMALGAVAAAILLLLAHLPSVEALRRIVESEPIS
jgi:hypothetical protein